jgi:S1-C subfamily serine protease
MRISALAALCLSALLGVLPAGSALQRSAGDSSLISAVCPVVYPDDQAPAARGYRYTFFGNAFFINDQGYLLTVAHVLETFRDGGQPYILIERPNSPPRLLKVTIIATDAQHDVAILRATSNPFAAKYKVSALPLSSEPPVRGESVLALSLHPARNQDAHSFESPREDFSPGQILSFESTQLEKSAPASDVFLLSHPVVLGQSGSPVIARDSNAVVGLVEGRWLRSSSASLSVQTASAAGQANAVPGAAIPIRHAIDLLNQNNIAWQHPTAPQSPQSAPSR